MVFDIVRLIRSLGIVILLALAWAGTASAQQCVGQFLAGEICGNASGAQAPPGATSNPVLGNGSLPGSLTLTPGTAPTSPVNGQLWSTSLGLFAQINGVTTALGSGVITIGTTPVSGGSVNQCLYIATGPVVGAQACSSLTTITVGSTSVASGTNGYILYDNSGTLGDIATTGSGNVALSTSPVFTTPVLGNATANSINGLNISTTVGGTLTIPNGSTLALSGAFGATFTLTGTTAVTFPTSGTLATVSQVPSLPLSPANGGTGVANSTTLTLATANITLTANGSGSSVTLPASGTLVNTAVTTLSSLTSIGTIGTGVWQGTIVAPAYGGTGVNNTQTLTLAGSGNITFTAVSLTNVTLPANGTLVSTTTTSLPSLTTVGTIGTGVWQATPIGPAYGGTGEANNAANTITFSGNYGLTLTLSNTTALTLPTSGTVLSSAAAVTLAQGGTNANLASAASAGAGGVVYNTTTALSILANPNSNGQCLLSGTSAPTWGSCTGSAAVSSVGNASMDTTLTLGGTGSGPYTGVVTVKLNLANANTWSGAQTFGSGDLILAGSSGTTTLNAATAASGTLTLPAATDTLVGRATTDTLTNKSIAGSEINSGIIGATYGGTGINNGASTITLVGSLSTTAVSGSPTLAIALTANTSVTLPTSGTLVNTGVTTLSSLTSIGTIGTGVWHGTLIGPTYGGTGVNNNSNTITLGASLTTTGASTPTLAFPSSSAYTYTFPASNMNVAALNVADQTLSGGANMTVYNIAALTGGTTTLDCGKNPLQYVNNTSGSNAIAPPTNDGSCIILIINGTSPNIPTFPTSGGNPWTESSNTGDPITGVTGAQFMVSVARIDGVSNYVVRALQ